MCLPELESEDLSNRIAVLAFQGGTGVADTAESVRIKNGGSVRKGGTKGDVEVSFQRA